MRLNCIDHYQAIPSPLDPSLSYADGDGVPEISNDGPTVPIIRVFGSTETGQKVCAHVHGALPYLYIEYNGALDPETGLRCLSLMYFLWLNQTPSESDHPEFSCLDRSSFGG